MNRRSGFGWLEFIEGVLLILLGIYTFTDSGKAFTGFIVLYGILAVVMGIADIILYLHMERYTRFGPIVSLISGTLSVMAGVMLLVYPNAGKWVLGLLFPLWFIAHCVSRIASLNNIRAMSGNFTYYFTLVMNILGLVLGSMMLVNPLLSWFSLRYIVALYLTLLGIDCIVIAFSKIGSQY